MLTNQLTDTNDKKRGLENANKELTLLKDTLEEGLSETERTLKENSEMHIKVFLNAKYVFEFQIYYQIKRGQGGSPLLTPDFQRWTSWQWQKASKIIPQKWTMFLRERSQITSSS